MGLFGKRRNEDGGERTRVYYASDIHGTEVLWRKFLRAPEVYGAGVIVMGGDVTGKVVIPLVDEGGALAAELFGQPERAVTDQEREELEHKIRSNGMYPHVMSPDEVERVAGLSEDERELWFARVMLETFDRWMALAEERLSRADVRCFVMPGNDDPPGVDDAIERASRVEACDERVVEFGPYSMVSLGYSNPTPFDSPRELDEDELYRRVEALMEGVDASHAILNLHVPPYDSQLDTAPELDEELRVVATAGQPRLVPVGSTAVRDLIERYQPMLTLHGHVHESRGATKIGRTLCINPGSDYHTGRISGVLVHLDGARADYQFVIG
ncbi:MAG: metallophosphoesterase [Acidobacteria bacterium]|nr:MAG: metallophosphoesterase [Acidobacteriota bacterium]GIK78719.1 MAG: metallophosphoesterase [Actinomycetes bacterium]